MEQRIEIMIEEDIASIQNKSVRTKRERALRAYYSNPNYCQFCGSLISVSRGAGVRDAAVKKFCNRSCAASYNNTVVNIARLKSFAQLCSKEDFIKAYNQSENYAQLGIAIGYTHVGSGIVKKIKERMKQLDLPEFESNSLIDISNMTKGELIKSRSNWQSWRSSVQKQARANYIRSGRPKRCAVCGYDNTYQVAHIKPVCEFDDNVVISEINNENNLVALCPNHHWEYDHLGLCLSEYV